MKRPRGLSLPEVMICMGMMGVLTSLLILIYSSSYSAFRRGTTRMSVTQRAREVVRRITPLIMSSKAPSPMEEAVTLPAIGNTGDVLEMNTADNLLVPMEPVNSRNPVHYRFRIQRLADRTVRLDRLNASGAPTGDQRILAYDVEDMAFERLAVNLVKLSVKTEDNVQTAINQKEALVVERTAVISIPYYSSAR